MSLDLLFGLGRILLVWLLGLTAFLIPFGFYQRWLEREIVRQLCLILMTGHSLDEFALEQLQVMRPESEAILEEMHHSARPIAWTAGYALELLRSLDA